MGWPLGPEVVQGCPTRGPYVVHKRSNGASLSGIKVEENGPTVVLSGPKVVQKWSKKWFKSGPKVVQKVVQKGSKIHNSVVQKRTGAWMG